MNATIEPVFRKLFRVRDRRPIVEWAHDNIRFGSGPFPGPFDVDNFPWTRRIYEAWQDPKVRRIVISGAPQKSGKTVVAQVCMSWQIANDPAPMGFYSDTDSKAKDFSMTRWSQMQEQCPVVGAKLRRDNKQEKVFKDGTFLLIRGAESKSARESHTLRIIIKDEAWMYGEGHSAQIDNRKESYDRTEDWKIMELGTGGTVGHDFAVNHGKGTCEVWEVPCPHCGEYHDYKWRQSEGGVFRWDMKYESDGKTVDMDATLATVHIECPHCREKITWSKSGRIEAHAKGRWRATNDHADPSVVSLTIPVFVAGGDWADQVREWIDIGQGYRVGKKQALYRFIIYKLAEFWEDIPVVARQDLPRGGYKREDLLDGKRWDREWCRIATADYQHGMDGDRRHLWFVVRAYAENGDSRLVDCGRVEEFADLHVRLERAGVQPAPNGDHSLSRVFIDMAYDRTTVLDECLHYGWMGIRGEDRDSRGKNGSFPHTLKDKKGGRLVTVWRSYSKDEWLDTGVGRASRYRGYVPAFHIDNQACQDILYELRSGKGLLWEVPEDIEEFCPEYAKHLASHAKMNVAKDGAAPEFKWTAIGRSDTNPDHLYDCEKYQVGAALRAALYSESEAADAGRE